MSTAFNARNAVDAIKAEALSIHNAKAPHHITKEAKMRSNLQKPAVNGFKYGRKTRLAVGFETAEFKAISAVAAERGVSVAAVVRDMVSQALSGAAKAA